MYIYKKNLPRLSGWKWW